MAGGVAAGGERYSGLVGGIYVFNIVVGFGALTLPAVFYEVGFVLAGAFLILLCFISYITATFIIESLAIANAVKYLELDCDEMEVEQDGLAGYDGFRRGNFARINLLVSRRNTSASTSASIGGTSQKVGDNLSRHHEATGECNDSSNSSSKNSLPVEAKTPSKRESDDGLATRVKIDLYELRDHFELGDLALMFLGKFGFKVLAGVTALYLAGDLAIFATATPTALVNVFPGSQKSITIPWLSNEPIPLDRGSAYNMWLVIFGLVVIPLSCLDFQKTKHLQLFTCIYRNVALVSMVFIAINRYWKHYALVNSGDQSALQEAVVEPPISDFSKLPKLVGAATYAFMCHHSIPAVIFPIRDSSRHFVTQIMAVDFICILAFYMALCMSAMLAFGTWQELECVQEGSEDVRMHCKIQKLYILTFRSIVNPAISDMLTMLPVFVCFTNYPLIAITTRNNLLPWFEYLRGRLWRVFGWQQEITYHALSTNMDSIEVPSHASGQSRECHDMTANLSPTGKEQGQKKPSGEFGDTGTSKISSVSENGCHQGKSSLTSQCTVSSENALKPKLWHSLLVAVLPLFVGYFVRDVGRIVEFTGSYAGISLEFLFPCWLVFAARRRLRNSLDNVCSAGVNPYASPFQGNFWIRGVVLWALISLFFIVTEQIAKLDSTQMLSRSSWGP